MLEGFRYRYDGLFRIARYWQDDGQHGFKIWRFRIEKWPESADELALEDLSDVEP